MRPTAAAKDGLLPDSGRPSIPSGLPTRAWLESIVARELRQPGQLAGASGHHQSAASLGGVARRLEPVAHEFEDLLHARTDDSHELGLRQMARMILVVAEPLYGDGFAVVGGRGDASAVQES